MKKGANCQYLARIRQQLWLTDCMINSLTLQTFSGEIAQEDPYEVVYKF